MRRLALLLAAFFSVALAAGGVLLLWLLVSPLPAPRLATEDLRILDRHGRLLYAASDPERGSHRALPLGTIAPSLVLATIATEDASFYSNPGVDALALLRALWQNLRGGEVVAGGSTITQQVARNLYLAPEERGRRDLWRKLRETVIAFRITRDLGKGRILELYLNQMFYGHGAYGVEAAARAYFGKSASDLDLAESALLAGLPQAPARYDPLVDLQAARARQRQVLGLMVRRGFITEEQAAAAAEQPLRLAPAPFPVRAPHFAFWVLGQIDEVLGEEQARRAAIVRTTLDLDLQEAAEQAVARHLARLRDHHVSNAAVVALDPATGEIQAMVGSADYFDDAIQGAVNMALAHRQPGSAFKPITYAAALSRGFTAATPLLDVPTVFRTRTGGSFTPENYDRQFHGVVPLREALASSYNVPAVATLDAVGLPAVLALARALGLTTLDDDRRYDLSLTLGGGEVRLLDLTAAYAAFAAGGIARRPVAVLEVLDAGGAALSRAAPSSGERVLDPRVAYILTDILADDVARSPSFGRDGPLVLDRPAAAKTGTTSDWRDNWTVGYTPQLVVGVWVGNADNSPMQQVSGIDGAAPIWHDVMLLAHHGIPPRPFPRPEGLVEAEVCRLDGLLATDLCPHRRQELFIAGTEPVQPSTAYRRVRIDLESGELAGERCPAEQVVERVLPVLPPAAWAWARENGVQQAPATVCRLHSSPRAVLTRGTSSLRWIYPHDGAVFALSREVPASAQQLLLQVEPGAGAGTIALEVDGVLLRRLQGPPYQAAWPLAAGVHVAEALHLSDDGQVIASARLRFEVRPPE